MNRNDANMAFGLLSVESVLGMQKLLMAAAAVEAPAKAITKFLFKCTNNQ